MEILFICTDNFTRSITAEFCCKHYLHANKISDVEVHSAGMKADSDLSGFSHVHFDRMKELGVDTSTFKRTQFHESFLDKYDVMVAMGIEHRDYLITKFGRKVFLFNEMYKNEETSIVIPPPDQEGLYLSEIRHMVDYIFEAMPIFVENELIKKKYS